MKLLFNWYHPFNKSIIRFFIVWKRLEPEVGYACAMFKACFLNQVLVNQKGVFTVLIYRTAKFITCILSTRKISSEEFTGV